MKKTRGIARCWDWVTDSVEGSFTYGNKRETTHEIWVDGIKIKPTDIVEYNSGGFVGGNFSYHLGEHKKNAQTIVVKETIIEKDGGNVIWEETVEYVFFRKLCPYAYKRV